MEDRPHAGPTKPRAAVVRNPNWHWEALPVAPYQRIGQAIFNAIATATLGTPEDITRRLFNIEDEDLLVLLKGSEPVPEKE